jgi:hypothetical protein
MVYGEFAGPLYPSKRLVAVMSTMMSSCSASTNKTLHRGNFPIFQVQDDGLVLKRL